MIRQFLLKLRRRGRLEQDLEEEMAFHREMSGEGAAPFGNLAVIREQAYDLWRFTTVENLWRDVVYGVRGLRRHPSLVATALLSLGLGIGANTALFSLGVEFLLSEPSVRDGQSLVALKFNGNSHADTLQMTAGRDLQAFADIAGENEETFINWNNGQETKPIFSTVTTKNYFTMLGVPLLHGRGYETTDPDQVVVLNYHFWMQHFNGDAGVVGRSMTLDGRPYTVTGVLPKNYRTLIGFGFSPDVILPVFAENTYLAAYARLKPGMTREQAQSAALAIVMRSEEARSAGVREAHPQAVAEPVAGLARLRNEQMVTVGAFVAILLTLSGLVLLIACANVASLLLARASGRRREIDVRLSLGASRGRLMQQLLVESLLLSVGGALCGLGLAQWLNSALSHVTAPTPVPMRLTAEIDWRVGLYAAALSMIATIACGLLPAWQSVRESMTHDARSTARMFVRRAIVVGQVAVSIVVLSAGVLFVRNLLKSSAMSPGFDVRQTVRAQVNLPLAAHKEPRQVAAYAEQAIQAMEAIPGIKAAAAARVIPFTDSIRFGSKIQIKGQDAPVRTLFNWNAVTAKYFEALSIPLLAGRTFVASDATSTEHAVMVSTGWVSKILKMTPREAIGQSFEWGGRKTGVYRVVGVVGNTKNMTMGEVEQPQLYEYLPATSEDRPHLQLVASSAVPPIGQLKPIDEALRRIDPNAGVETQTLFSSIGFAFLPSQIGAAVLGGMGLLGLLLAMIGLYGVMAYSVARRTPEIGVRMAIGASAGSIFQLVLQDAVRMVGIGAAIGVAVALMASRPLASFLIEGLPTHDPVTFLSVVGLFGVTALVASWGPARRATAIDPMSCLRHE